MENFELKIMIESENLTGWVKQLDEDKREKYQ